MIFSKNLVANSKVANAQYAQLWNDRMHANASEKMFGVNAGLIPRDVYQDIDNVTVTRMRSDDGDTFLNDLLPLSQSVNIGKLVSKWRTSSDAGNAQTSMSGQVPTRLDQVEYAYDGTLIPMHTAGYIRNFRELAAQNSEGFDALIDDQRETVATIRSHLATTFMDGHRDNDGNVIVLDGLSWSGMRNDTRVAQATLTFDFTDVTKTGEEIKNAFIAQLRNIMWINNNVSGDLTYYVSREIAANIERRFNVNFDSKTVSQELSGLMGVAEIKTSNKLTGNQIMGFVLDSNKIRPVVGMAVSTIALPRATYKSNHEFEVACAIGWAIRKDFAGKTSAIYGD
jgi:hypothetical protein